MLLSNLNELKNDMVSKKWTICSFLFRYKSVVYIVLVKRFVGKEKRVNQYALSVNAINYYELIFGNDSDNAAEVLKTILP